MATTNTGSGRCTHKENLEAGCQQCHSQEIVTEMADTLDAGREIFRLRGCMACHRYEGFDRDPDELSAVNQDIRQLDPAESRVDARNRLHAPEGRQYSQITTKRRSSISTPTI